MSNYKVTGSPDRIWLQYGDLDGDCTHAECEGVSWCVDSVFSSDVEYVRADLAPVKEAAKAEELHAEIKRLRGLVEEMAEHGTYETEYDGRVYMICHGCGAQDGEEHRSKDCLYVRAQADSGRGA